MEIVLGIKRYDAASFEVCRLATEVGVGALTGRRKAS